MARKRRHRRSSIEDPERMLSEQRDFLYNPKPAFAAPSLIRELEDRRNYAPAETYPRGLFHRSTRLVVSQPNVNKAREVPRKVVFNVPEEVAVCVRRKSRREVLFALKRTGKGSSKKIRRRTAMSKLEC